MIRIFLLLAIILLPCSLRAQSYVASGTCTTGGNSCSVTVSVQAGDYILVIPTSCSSGQYITSMSDTVGTSFTLIDGYSASSDYHAIYMGTALATNASDSVAVTFASGACWAASTVVTYRGLTGTDQNRDWAFAGSTTSTVSTGTATTTQTNELIVAVFFFTTSNTLGISAGTGYTLRQAPNVLNGNAWVIVEDKTIAAAGGVSGTANIPLYTGGSPTIGPGDSYLVTFPSSSSGGCSAPRAFAFSS